MLGVRGILALNTKMWILNTKKKKSSKTTNLKKKKAEKESKLHVRCSSLKTHKLSSTF